MDYMDMDNLRFLLYEVIGIQDVLAFEKHSDFDLESIDIMLDALKDLADSEMYPYFKDLDEKPAMFKDGKLLIHPQIGNIIKAIAENGFIGAHFSPEHGGMNIPHMMEGAAGHIFLSANNHTAGYTSLTTGAADLITSFGSDDQIETYVPNMLAGKWMGTMSLTEPEAGSSLGDLTTTAIRTEDGYFNIKGQKIFISGGDHQFGENFIHMVIARIEGAPAGSKGISMFIVPKFRLKEDGGLEPNDVLTAGDYQKLGQRGYCTTHLMFGENNDCRGYLIGEENRGLKYMFQMMNQARLEVGMIAASTATAAYHASLHYAKERAQGRRMNKDGYKAVEQTLIINHPDVRRMLLKQKAITEGAVALLLQTYKYYDLMINTEGEEKNKNNLMLDLLTPLAKTFPSDFGIESISNGVQVLGGYGFTKDFPLEQYYRDIRITSLYEGTSGIQALDLLSRKVTAQNGQALMVLMAEMNETINDSKEYDELVPYAEKLTDAIAEVQKVMEHLLPFAFQKQYERFLADATLFLDFTEYIVVSWQWLKMALVAKRALQSGELQRTKNFYLAKIHTMKYYFVYELPKIMALSETLRAKDELTIVAEDDILFD